MSQYDGRTAWIRTYRQQALQLGALTLAIDWHKLSHQLAADNIALTAEQAAAWASRGYYPAEAEPLIRDRITAEMDGEMERYAEDQAGGPEAHLKQRLTELTESGTLDLDDDDDG